MSSRARAAALGLAVMLLAFRGAAATGESSGQRGIKDYEEARILFWHKLYSGGGHTLYCNESFGGGYNRGINIEHVFPMSWVTNALHCGRRKECEASSPRFNRIESDLHNLFPARSDVNYARGSMSFGMVSGERRWSGGCDFEVDERRRVAEPRPGARGEIARAMFYMRDTYGLVIYRRLGDRLKQWNREDPVSAFERQRNDAIEKIQGNRNKYIDHPELADTIEF